MCDQGQRQPAPSLLRGTTTFRTPSMVVKLHLSSKAAHTGCRQVTVRWCNEQGLLTLEATLARLREREEEEEEVLTFGRDVNAARYVKGEREKVVDEVGVIQEHDLYYNIATPSGQAAARHMVSSWRLSA